MTDLFLHTMSNTDNAKANVIFRAVERGAAEEVGRLLADPRLLEAEDDYDTRPLMHASNIGHTTMVTMLLERGADVHASNAEDYTALHMAAREGHVGVAEMLLGRGAVARCRNEWEETPLMLAAEEGHLQLVAMLLWRVGPEGLDDRDCDGHTALCCACLRGQVDVARLLLRAGADPSVLTINGLTVRGEAEDAGQASCLDLLQVGGLYSADATWHRWVDTPLPCSSY